MTKCEIRKAVMNEARIEGVIGVESLKGSITATVKGESPEAIIKDNFATMTIMSNDKSVKYVKSDDFKYLH